MKLLEKLSNFIFRRITLLITALVFACILFKEPIETILSQTLVKYVLSEIDGIWYNDFIFFLIASGTVLLYITRFRKYTPSSTFSAFLFLITGIYLFYRFSGTPWDFTPFSSWTAIKYLDVLILVSIGQLLLFVPNKRAIRETESNAFFDDQPLGSEGIDDLSYESYAELLSGKILSSHFEKSFAIGINGKWGIGKTSFIDLLKRNVKGEDIIEIDFKAWNSHSPQSIIKDFFETVQEKIRPYHSSLSRQLIQYSDKLVNLNSNSTTQSIQSAVTALTGFESLNSMYKDINRTLKSIDHKIVVYIDDLDRLDKHEIIEVIRLIRNTANFYNTFFIVAYDRNYVVDALKEHTQYKQEKFLEKIFQIEVSLPYFNKDRLRHKLAEKLKSRLSADYYSTIKDDILGTPGMTPKYLNVWLENMRDVTRLANTLLLNLDELAGEVVFDEFMRIELLRLKYPSAYDLLYRQTSEILEVISESPSKGRHYVLKRIPEEQKKELKEDETQIKTFLELFLTRDQGELSIPSNEISKIVSLVDSLFAGDLSFQIYPHSPLSIIYPIRFNLYFTYSLLNGVLSEVGFTKARTLNQGDFNEKISQWVNEGLQLDLRNRFVEIKTFGSRQDFEKIIKAIFHLANQPSHDPNFYATKLVGYDNKDLNDKLSNYKNKLVEKFYHEEGGIDELRSFVNSLFEQAVSPFTFEAEFIRYLNLHRLPDTTSELSVLPEEKGFEIVLDYFQKYCEQTDSLDSDVWNLFHCCKKKEWIPTNGDSYTGQDVIPKKTEVIMKDFLLNKDLDGFLYAIVDPKPFEKKKFAVSKFVVELFGSWHAFEKELSKQNESKSKYLKEFKKFLSVFAAKNYEQFVEFEFEEIPIQEKTKRM